MIKSTSTKFWDWVIAFVCFILILICILPVINIASRSISDPIALIRNEVLLLPVTYDKEFPFEFITDNNGNLVTVTAIVEYLPNQSGHIIKSTRLVREITNDAGETVQSTIGIGNIYSARIGVVEVKEDSGTPLTTLTVGDVTFEHTFDEETGRGIKIFENSNIWIIEKSIGSVGVQFSSYTEILKDSRYTWSLAWTAMLTVACALLSIFMTAICAYPLTYDHLKGRKFFNTMIILTMYFNAGTIPMYLLLKDLNLINSPFVLALPYCLSVFNMIIMRSYFYGIPMSLRESAELDGAGPIRTMIFIYLPLSMPVIATLSLFYAVGRWNGYSDAMMFMNSNETFFPIQYLLYNMIMGIMSPDVVAQGEENFGVGDSMKMAMIMFAMIPILIVYPFLQRYFIAGVTLGAVKE